MIRAQSVYSVGGYSLNFASPGPIGGTTPGPGTFTTLEATTALKVGGNVDGGMCYVWNSGYVLSTVAATNGQILIGKTGLQPALGTLTGTTNQIVVTNGSGSITLSAPGMIAQLNVNTTQVGNVGAGTDDLMSYVLPANTLSANGKGIRVTAWGTISANAGAKTLTFVVGATTVMTSFDLAQGGAIVGSWIAEVLIFRTGANAQTVFSTVTDTLSGFSAAVRTYQTTSAETDTSTITLKFTGNSAAAVDNDIVQKGLLVEFIN